MKQNKFVRWLANSIETTKQVFFLIFDAIFDGIDFIAQRLFRVGKEVKVSKVIAFLASIAAAYYSIDWAFSFVNAPPAGYSGAEIAAIVGAVLTPITAIITGVLMRFVFNKVPDAAQPAVPHETPAKGKEKDSEAIGDSSEK